MKGGMRRRSGGMISREKDRVLVGVEMWVGGMKVSRNGRSEGEKGRGGRREMRGLGGLGIGKGGLSLLML